MNAKYDSETDALYLRFAEGLVADTEEMRPGIMLDSTPRAASLP